MPPRRQTTCKVCGKDAYTYPHGRSVPYCRDHIRLRKAKNRGQHRGMTGPMMDALQLLKTAGRALPLRYPGTDRRTVAKLLEYDWIIEDSLEAGCYTITRRGDKALAAFEKPASRRDGICPMCGLRARNVRASGKRDAYCKPCLSVIAARKRAQWRKHGRLDRPCSRCRKRPRYQYPGGSWSSYCEHCARIVRRRNMRKNRRHLVRDVKRGWVAVPPCKHCKAMPRKVFANSISDYCAECGSKLARKRKLKRVLQKVVQP